MKCPSKSVSVPFWVFFSKMETEKSGSPLADMTVPEMAVWAVNWLIINQLKKKKGTRAARIFMKSSPAFLNN